MDLAVVIKQIVKNYVDNACLSDLVYGTYLGSELKIDNKPLPIPADMIDMIKSTTVAAGDRVAVIQKSGGQRYLIVGAIK